MKLEYRSVTMLVCAAALAAWSGVGFAASFHQANDHHRDRTATLHRTAAYLHAVKRGDHDRVKRGDRGRFASPRTAGTKSHGRPRRGRQVALHRRTPQAGLHTSNPMVADARKYIGTNPTGRKRLWCGAFMDMILRQTGHKGGGNLALGYLHYGHRVSGPRIGAIAVMRRRGGGHVGLVSGIDVHGNPIIISGNHNHTVAESVYPRQRIVGYVVPNS